MFADKNRMASRQREGGNGKRCRAPTLALTAGLFALAGCASGPQPMDLAAHQALLAAKQDASTDRYTADREKVQQAAHAVLSGMDRKFQMSLSSSGLSAARGWSTYMGLANVVGTDFWVVQIKPVDGEMEVYVNAVTRSSNRGPLDMAVPDASGFVTDIPLSSEGGLTPEEMRLFHQRLNSQLLGRGAGPTCAEAFGDRASRFPLTCGRGGITTYF